MPCLSYRTRILWENHHTTKNCAPRSQNSKIPGKRTIPKVKKKQKQRYIVFANYYRNYIPRPSGKILGFYELLKADKQIKVTEELLDNYKAINRWITGR